jgi:ABC-type Fe3+-hydroxamate transport system substrate-binding protein
VRFCRPIALAPLVFAVKRAFDLTLAALLLAVAAVVVGAVWFRGMPGPGKWGMDQERIHRPRIVALSPAVAVTLRDLGLADRIVGRHAYDLALDPAVPVCGDQSTIDYETLLRMRPTHILTEWGSRDIPPRLKEFAQRSGCSLQDYTQLHLEDVIANTTRLGTTFAEAEGATSDPGHKPLADLVRRMNAAWRTPHAPIPAGRILLLESLDPPSAVGPGSFHQDILERLGGTPAIASGKAYMTLSLEDILRLAPDGIVILAPRPPRTPQGPAPSPDDLVKRLGRVGTLDIPAIRRKHIALIDDPCCLLPSSALLIYSDQLEAILKRWAEP